MKPKIYSVHQINSYIKSFMENDIFLSGFFIEAEISNFKEHTSGHLYFTLKDEKAAINAVMFRSYAAEVPFTPENGMKVIIYGRVSLYEKTGQYQLYAELMEPSGTGGLYLAFLQLKARLEGEGLFDEANKKPLPARPETIAVVTSKTGAAVRDIINVAKRRNKNIQIVVAPVQVQGASAAAEIAEAIKAVNKWGRADVIITGRGGGSMEDLWAFNEEIVARAVCESKIPVVSAVGHETDYTICDFAADLRAPTPSAAAEICVPDLSFDIGRLARSRDGIESAMAGKIASANNALNQTMAYMPSLTDIASRKKERLSNISQKLEKEMQAKFKRLDERTIRSIQALNLVAPLNVLKRGFSVLYIDDKIVRSISEVEADKEMSVRVSDGMVYGLVLKAEGLHSE